MNITAHLIYWYVTEELSSIASPRHNRALSFCILQTALDTPVADSFLPLDRSANEALGKAASSLLSPPVGIKDVIVRLVTNN